MQRETLTPKPFAASEAPYSQGVKVRGYDSLIFVAAQVALDADGKIVGAGDMEAQMHQVIRNVERVLAEGGATLADIVKVTVFITDLANFKTMARVRAHYFRAPLPASSFAVVTSLSRPEMLVAMEAIAAVGAPQS